MKLDSKRKPEEEILNDITSSDESYATTPNRNEEIQPKRI